MVIIINASNIKVGGGIQVTLGLIEEFIKKPDSIFHIFCTPQIYQKILNSNIPENLYIYLIENSTASFRFRISTLKRLNQLETRIKPDIVFTVFGPSYWTPKSVHLMGFALGLYIYPDSLSWKESNFIAKIKFIVLKKIKLYFIKKDACYYYTETLDAKIRLSKLYLIPLENIVVASNSFHPIYNIPKKYQEYKLEEKKNNEFRLITISSFYSHKNLTIINKIVKILKNNKTGILITFVLTLPPNVFKTYFKESKHIINIGPVSIEECPSIYKQCDSVFLPTLLEIFSASYLEAMKMQLPILTSNLPFSQYICGDAALYFNPLDPREILSTIFSLSSDDLLKKSLISNGTLRLGIFDNSEMRAEKIFAFCQNIIQLKTCLNPRSY